MRFQIRVKAVVRFLCAALVVSSFGFAARASAQVTAVAPVAGFDEYNNRWDVTGGAQYSHFNPSSGRNVHAINLLGWNGGATVYFRPSWGIETSVRGLYGNLDLQGNDFNIPTNASMSEHLFLFGPTFRIMRRQNYTVGLHTLIGAAYGSFDKDFPQGVTPNQVGIFNNKLAWGGAFGAWSDYNLRPRWAVRFTADYQPTRYGYALQNEFAGSVGIVYRVGSLHK
ncbi:hypothetical protein [Silvibacterium acidisoli]|uniref:hypothetical protein n=1 Tax=Acidobacteriaceae bacterium ZG23-2 TaxID=2883246 RepID=UPI00406C3478